MYPFFSQKPTSGYNPTAVSKSTWKSTTSGMTNSSIASGTLASKAADPGHSISALFDNKDGGFGSGGLLGLRGGVPKLPSFRVGDLKVVLMSTSVREMSQILTLIYFVLKEYCQIGIQSFISLWQ